MWITALSVCTICTIIPPFIHYHLVIMSSFVKNFRQAAPYIHRHHQHTFVICFDGQVVDSKQFASLIADIALLVSLGIKLVLVAGMRTQINRCLQTQNHESQYAQQWRITDKTALACAKMACGQTNSDIQAMLLREQPQIRVCSGNFITAKPVGIREGIDFMYTGQVRRIDTEAINDLLSNHNVVLVSPLGYSPTGETFNLNYSEVAATVAQALQAQKWICFNQDFKSDLDSQLSLDEAQRVLPQLDTDANYLLQLAIDSCQQKVQRVHFIKPDIDGGLLQELFTRDGAGLGNSLMVTQDSYDDMRTATIEDVGGILALIRPLEKQGILVRRSRKKLEMEIDYFVVQQRDNKIIACAALYPYPEDNMAEMACLVVHPDYQDSGRGDVLLRFMQRQAQAKNLNQVFVLTTHTAHWFLERGFKQMDLNQLPLKRLSLYNYQRLSKVFVKSLQ